MCADDAIPERLMLDWGDAQALLAVTGWHAHPPHGPLRELYDRLVSLRAAQREADRAPGEVDAVAAVLAGKPRCYCPDDWRQPYDKAGCPQHGSAAWPEERHRREAHKILAALDALRSEQGQSRDDTVAEIVDFIRNATAPEIPNWNGRGGQDSAADAIERRFGAGRAEGEDRG